MVTKDSIPNDRVRAGFCIYVKFQEYARSFQEPEIEFSRSNICKEISMPYIVFQCFLC